MKNIIIAGCPRSGKTTLANLIKKRYPYYNILYGDVVRNTLAQFIEHKQLQKIVHDDEVFCKFMVEYVNANIEGSNYPFIVEWSRFYSQFSQQIKGDNILISLSLGDASASDIFCMCRQYDEIKDFTFHEEDDRLAEQCRRWAEVNRRINCQNKKNMVCYNTYHNRAGVFKEILQYVETSILL